MAKNRITKKVVSEVTETQMQEALSHLAATQAKYNTLKSKMDEEIVKVRKKYEEDLAELQLTVETDTEVVQIYCTENKEILFAKRKSIEYVHATVGFRTDTPSLKTEKGYTWTVVLDLLKKEAPEFVRVKEEPNKEEMLAKRAELEGLFKEIGVKVEQKETFFINCKSELNAV